MLSETFAWKITVENAFQYPLFRIELLSTILAGAPDCNVGVSISALSDRIAQLLDIGTPQPEVDLFQYPLFRIELLSSYCAGHRRLKASVSISALSDRIAQQRRIPQEATDHPVSISALSDRIAQQ